VSTGRRWIAAGTLLVVAAAIGIAAYFMRDGSAKERNARRPSPGVPVSVAAALQRDVPFKIGAIGNVEPYSTVAVKARVDGQILEVGFREGQQVSKGQILFQIDPRPFEAALKQAEANARRDAAARDQAASQAKRYKELLDKNFVSTEAYAQFATNAQTADAVARASQAALENARLNLAYCTILSPIDGYTGRVLLQAGNLVKANDANPLVIINQVRPIYVTFSVPEQQLPEIRKYRAAGRLPVEATAPGTEKPLAEGRLVFVDNTVDPATGTIKLRAQFENRDLALWPGQFVQVSLRLFEEAGAILVPATAVQTGPDGQYVYVIDAGATARVRPVTVERTEGDFSVVKGVKAGEHVVTSGALRLVPGAKVRVRAPAEAS
jgi:membrane fusion protein, multidrug efflux system